MATPVKAVRTAQFWQFTTRIGNHLPGLFPTSDVLESISNLAGADIYVDLLDETRLLAIVQSTKPSKPSHLTLYRVRHKDLPAMEQAGIILDLPISSKQNVAEETHIMFFPNNVIGVLFNQDGPRISRLPEYLFSQFSLDVGVRPLLDPDTARNLLNMGLITSIDLSIPVASAALLQAEGSDAFDTVEALKIMAEQSSGRTLQLKSVLSTRVDIEGSRVWRSFIDHIVPTPALNLFNKLKVHAKSLQPDQPSITIDFAEEQLVMRVSVALENDATRRVKPSSVQRELVRAHSNLASRINQVAPRIVNSLSFDDLIADE